MDPQRERRFRKDLPVRYTISLPERDKREGGRQFSPRRILWTRMVFPDKGRLGLSVSTLARSERIPLHFQHAASLTTVFELFPRWFSHKRGRQPNLCPGNELRPIRRFPAKPERERRAELEYSKESGTTMTIIRFHELYRAINYDRSRFHFLSDLTFVLLGKL